MVHDMESRGVDDRPVIGLGLWQAEHEASGNIAETGELSVAARATPVGRRLRALRRGLIERDGRLALREALHRMSRAVARAGVRSPTWMQYVVLAAAIDAEFVDIVEAGPAAAVVPGRRFEPRPNVRDINLADDDASLLVGSHAMLNGITTFAATSLDCDDRMLLSGLHHLAAGAIEFDLADAVPLVAAELVEAELLPPGDADREAGNLLREGAIVHQELGWLDCIDVRTPGYPYLRLTEMGCVGFLLLMAELEGGRPAWLDELAREHGRLPARDGYIDLADVGVDVVPN